MKLVDIIKSKNGLYFLGENEKLIDTTNIFRLEKEIVEYDEKKVYTINKFSYKKYVHFTFKCVCESFSNTWGAITNPDVKRKLQTRFYNFDGDFIAFENELITYQPYNKIQLIDDNGNFLPKGRQSMTLHKFLSKTLGDTVNEYTLKVSADEMISYLKEFELTFVEGADIAKTYSDLDCDGWGRSSCMSGQPESWFQIYSDNPDVCKLGLIKSNGEIVARFLYWYNSETQKWYADRLYYINEVVREWQVRWCRENNIDSDSLGYRPTIKIQLVKDVKSYESLPYMDNIYRTFGDNFITNYEGKYILQEQDGVAIGVSWGRL